MTTVAEIEAAIRQLPEDEARQLSAWLVDYLDDAWDAQIKTDAEAGRLDAFIARAEADIAAGDVRNLDEVLLLAKEYSNAETISNPQSQAAEQVDQAELKRRWAEWVEDLADIEAETIASKRSWLELEGIAAGAGREENAQVWVTKMRDEWDDRENQWQTSV
ncbi:hypothetical protein [Acaryochloris marina]|uniref:Uncharacterized protein n=1 Tax=Acaryochloris marina (strain MBIC 11017) TaxID=329726 RepID=B0C0Y9_ACAM1|nr:hypothetical protein AM1_2235 [Acaryochloris marina MBIC11017]BDM81996.1 hypothetical protein AM10699_48600 [Acaryochloris marina MBIC10699]